MTENTTLNAEDKIAALLMQRNFLMEAHAVALAQTSAKDREIARLQALILALTSAAQGDGGNGSIIPPTSFYPDKATAAS